MMDYPQVPTNLQQASYGELSRAEINLRHYKNVTILGIKHWRAIPQLKDAAKQVNKDQRRVLKEIKARPEFHKVIMPSPKSRAIINAHVAAQMAKRITPESQPEKINTGDRVHSNYHNADGDVIRLEWSARVGGIYHVRLNDGRVVCVARGDLTKKENDNGASSIDS